MFTLWSRPGVWRCPPITDMHKSHLPDELKGECEMLSYERKLSNQCISKMTMAKLLTIAARGVRYKVANKVQRQTRC